VRRMRRADSFLKRTFAQTFYRLLSLMGVRTVFNHADYRLLSRRAIEALRQFGEINLYLRGIVPLIGFPSVVIQYDRASRFAGASKYSFRKSAALAIDAVTSFSVVPLRLISLLGLSVFIGSMIVTGWALWVVFVADKAIPGWASVVLPMYFLGGIQLLALGTIGEYLGKLYVEAKGRPRFLVEQFSVNRAPPDSTRAPAQCNPSLG
jgi:polyisoprenyl-phosphate glycosyltransferase